MIILYKWHVWRIGSKQWFVLLERLPDGKSAAVYVSPDGERTWLTSHSQFPDVRLHYPAKQEHIPARTRAMIRADMSRQGYVQWQ